MQQGPEKLFLRLIQLFGLAIIGLAMTLVFFVWVLLFGSDASLKQEPVLATLQKSAAPAPLKVNYWQAPALESIPGDEKEEIMYGRELIANTAAFLGPNGSVDQISNGLNCQNCHLDAGTKPFGNNYSAVASTYPKIRARSGQEESIEKRINDCFERSLNGESLPNDSKEMRAMVAYMKWLGNDVAKGERPEGVGLVELPYLDRAADPIKGKQIYTIQCASCHGTEGEGVMASDGKTYTYPPLWGANSYNSGAGLYRMSRFAGYVKANMPLGASIEFPLLSDEQSWDVAAYVNSQIRPAKDLSGDWPDISKKPIDHPFGPYSDGFSEEQHKFGPFKPIAEARKKAVN